MRTARRCRRERFLIKKKTKQTKDFGAVWLYRRDKVKKKISPREGEMEDRKESGESRGDKYRLATRENFNFALRNVSKARLRIQLRSITDRLVVTRGALVSIIPSDISEHVNVKYHHAPSMPRSRNPQGQFQSHRQVAGRARWFRNRGLHRQWRSRCCSANVKMPTALLNRAIKPACIPYVEDFQVEVLLLPLILQIPTDFKNLEMLCTFLGVESH